MPIFVGGTGRSGTSHLSKIIGEHPDIWSPNQEGRFIVDAGGLEDVVDTLSGKYTNLHANDCIDRLDYLLNTRLKGKEQSGFIIWNHEENFGLDNYRLFTNNLLKELTWYEYQEVNPDPYTGNPVSLNRKVGKYFNNREDIISICRSNVSNLFYTASKYNNKKDWCEKTPFNFLSFSFLKELFPDSKLIHIMRHPLQVAASYKDAAQMWAPNDISQVCNYLEPLYRRWISFKKKTDIDFIELRLEETSNNWSESRKTLFNKLGFDDFDTPSKMKKNSVEHKGIPLSSKEESIVRERLSFAIKELEYE